jgi:2-phospho-L-lactate guanylyltransferase
VTTLIVPVRDFDGMTRLSDSLSPTSRGNLARDLAERVVSAGLAADLNVVVVTSNDEVTASMGPLEVAAWADPGGGLTLAATHAVERVGDEPWIVAHGDLPLVSPKALRRVVQELDTATVLVPSSDGGTNVIASRGQFRFSYGVGSFHRHLASVPTALVLTDPRLAIDIDLPAHLGAVDLYPSATIER